MIYGTFEEPLFFAKDVAEWIDYAKTGNGSYDVSKMLTNVDDCEKSIRKLFVAGQMRSVSMLTEDGLYEVLMQSKKPIARSFKKEVKKILKSIKKDGMYAKDELLDDVDLFVKTVTRLKRERDERLRLEQENKQKDEEIQMLKPKAEYTDAMLGSDDSLLVREYCKILKSNGIDIGEKRMYIWLRFNGYLNDRNEPYQRYMEYFDVLERVYDNGYGTVHLSITPKINPKGQLYFFKKIKKTIEKSLSDRQITP